MFRVARTTVGAGRTILFAYKLRHPLGPSALDLLGDVTKGVVVVASELGHLRLHARAHLSRQVARLVRVLAAKVCDRGLDSRVDLNGEVASLTHTGQGMG